MEIKVGIEVEGQDVQFVVGTTALVSVIPLLEYTNQHRWYEDAKLLTKYNTCECSSLWMQILFITVHG